MTTLLDVHVRNNEELWLRCVYAENTRGTHRDVRRCIMDALHTFAPWSESR